MTALDSIAKRSGPVKFCDPPISPVDEGYPRRLRGLADAPKHLYVRGILPERNRAVAIVGSRAATFEALQRARELARELAEGGVVVVSGGALGIDGAAHQGALEARQPDAGHGRGGATVAVLGCGVDVTYPSRHRQLFAAICAGRGALVSQFRPGAPPRSWHFVRRNRTIAGMVDAVVVIGAGANSGALHTAEAARHYRRTVCAVPGSPGCEALIHQGAAVVHDPADVWSAMAGRPRRPTVALPEPGTSGALILARLDSRKSFDLEQIAEQTGLGVQVAARTLTGLELEGLVIGLPGYHYVRSELAQELLTR